MGAAISEALAEYGAVVLVASRNVSKSNKVIAKMRKRFKNRIQAVTMDVGSNESIREVYRQLMTKHKRIDVLVNNAYFGASCDLESMSDELWNQGIEGTINSVFRCTKHVIPFMKQAGKGSIINIASMYGMVSPKPEIYKGTQLANPPNYGSGKAAVIQFTRYSACHLAQYGIRVNAVSPGPFPDKKVQKNKKFISNLIEQVPLKRIGRPVDIKGITVLLASDASSFITGANYIIDGGWTAW